MSSALNEAAGRSGIGGSSEVRGESNKVGLRGAWGRGKYFTLTVFEQADHSTSLMASRWSARAQPVDQPGLLQNCSGAENLQSPAPGPRELAARSCKAAYKNNKITTATPTFTPTPTKIQSCAGCVPANSCSGRASIGTSTARPQDSKKNIFR